MMVTDLSVIMFSRELAESVPERQAEALVSLWSYVAENEGIVPNGAHVKLKQDFEDKSGMQRLYAWAFGVLYQPEVLRGSLSEENSEAIARMGFKVEKLSR